MTTEIRIWLELSHHTAFRVGGWAHLRHDGQALTGQAGGARRSGPDRAALLALLAALADLPDKVTVRVQTASPLVLDIPARIAKAEAGENPPTDDLDLWVRAATALKRPGLTLTRVQAVPGTPTAFAAAWAHLGRERAKDKGDFAAAIPKPNLAKAGV